MVPQEKEDKALGGTWSYGASIASASSLAACHAFNISRLSCLAEGPPKAGASFAQVLLFGSSGFFFLNSLE